MRLDQPALRRVWQLLALDLGLLLAEWIIPMAGSLWELLGGPAGEAVNDASVYLLWTLRAGRLVVWILTVVKLTHLPEAFRPARVFYLLRILAFVLTKAYAGIYGELKQPLAQVSSTLFAGEYDLVTVILLELDLVLIPPILPFAIRGLLRGGAEALRYFGLTDQAKKCRRCGARIAAAGVVLVAAFLIATVGLMILTVTTGAGLSSYLESPDHAVIPAVLLVTSLAVIIPDCLAILILWGKASGHMKRTCTLIKELSE